MMCWETAGCLVEARTALNANHFLLGSQVSTSESYQLTVTAAENTALHVIAVSHKLRIVR